MPLAPGTHLGPYEITGPLGSGGMGEVYRARDTRLERTVAIKILAEQLSSDPVRKQRFEREAKTNSSLNHPHICVLHDVGCQDGINYLVMECVEGETLAKRLEKGPLPLEGAEVRSTDCRCAGQSASQRRSSMSALLRQLAAYQNKFLLLLLLPWSSLHHRVLPALAHHHHHHLPLLVLRLESVRLSLMMNSRPRVRRLPLGRRAAPAHGTRR